MNGSKGSDEERRAALVTGASGGIGFAIASVFAAKGYALTVAGRRPDRIEAAAARLREEGAEVEPVAADFREEDSIASLVERHRARHGRLDAVANNAGVGVSEPIAETETRSLDLQLDVNLRAAYLLTRECIPLLREAGREHGKALLLQMASIAGKRADVGLPAYSATKYGLVGLTEAARLELADDGVQATVLCPGWVATPMTDWIADEIPKSSMLQPRDLAAAVEFLLATSETCVVPEIQLLTRFRPAG